MYPFIVRGLASEEHNFMLFGVAVLIPLAPNHNRLAYWVFRGKVPRKRLPLTPAFRNRPADTAPAVVCNTLAGRRRHRGPDSLVCGFGWRRNEVYDALSNCV